MIQMEISNRAFLGQPSGLSTLFFTEMWERFTYYGMRSILILFLSSTVALGGLGFDDKTASSIYGLYISATYVFSLLGGWIADRMIGARRAIIVGAVLIMIGNAMLTIGRMDIFFCGLLVIVLGVGLLKPNVSAMVALLYPDGGSRRDAGFSLFYMGISVGALLGSISVPLCALHFGWRPAFGLASIGMMFGLSYFLFASHRLPRKDLPSTLSVSKWSWVIVIAFLLGVTFVATLGVTGWLHPDPQVMAAAASWLIGLFALGYFTYLLVGAQLTREEHRRVYLMIVLFIAYAIFYAGFEQGGASLNLFAERYTIRTGFGMTLPAGILQGTTALYTILLAPLFAWMWIALGRRGRDLSSPAKFAVGLGLLGLGALVMVVASLHVESGHKVLPTWLLATYLLQECGDLCLSPVGLSSMTKLAPRRFAGQVMGVWFLALALGNNLAGQLSREYDAADLHSLPVLFLKIAGLGLGAAVLLGLLSPRLGRLMKDAG